MDINPNTDNVTITIAAAGGLVSILIVAVWRVANFIRDVRDEMRHLSGAVAGAWTRQQHERWCHRLERDNAQLPLKVPSPDPDDND